MPKRNDSSEEHPAKARLWRKGTFHLRGHWEGGEACAVLEGAVTDYDGFQTVGQGDAFQRGATGEGAVADVESAAGVHPQVNVFQGGAPLETGGPDVFGGCGGCDGLHVGVHVCAGRGVVLNPFGYYYIFHRGVAECAGGYAAGVGRQGVGVERHSGADCFEILSPPYCAVVALMVIFCRRAVYALDTFVAELPAGGQGVLAGDVYFF